VNLSRSVRISVCEASTRRRTLPVAQRVWHHHVTSSGLRNTVFAYELAGVGMFGTKLGRIAGLVLALAVVFGGIGVTAEGAGASHTAHTAIQFSTLTNDWE